MKMLQKIKSMSRLKKIIGIALACVVIYTLIGFLVLPPVLKAVLENKFSTSLNRQVVIEDIDINPYALSFTVEGLDIKGVDS